jgi:hypothetical protein
MTTKEKLRDHPPDALLLIVERSVNAKLPNGARVNIFRTEYTDHSMQTGIVSQWGPLRQTRYTDAAIGETDVDTIVRSVNDWIIRAGHHDQNKWTDDPDEAT